MVGYPAYPLFHAYHDLDLDWIWETVQNDLPKLLDQIKPLVKS